MDICNLKWIFIFICIVIAIAGLYLAFLREHKNIKIGNIEAQDGSANINDGTFSFKFAIGLVLIIIGILGGYFSIKNLPGCNSIQKEAAGVNSDNTSTANNDGNNYFATWSPSDLQHGCGHLVGNIHITNSYDDCWPQDEGVAGYSTYGPYVQLPSGDYMVTWEMSLVKDNPTTYAVTQLQVQNFTKVIISVQQNLYYNTFHNSDWFQKIGLNFHVPEDQKNDKFEFRVIHFGNATIKLKGVYLKKFT